MAIDLPFEITFSFLRGKNEKSLPSGKEIAMYLPDLFPHFKTNESSATMIPVLALNDPQVQLVNLLENDNILLVCGDQCRVFLFTTSEKSFQ